MKKIIALLLAAVMCLSLVACGKKLSAEEQELVNLAVPSNENPDSGNNINTDDHSSTAEEPAEPEIEVVEITMDNWQEYFEVKQRVTVNKNLFDEIESVGLSYALLPKGKDVTYYLDLDTIYDVTYEFHIPAGQYIRGYYEYDTTTNAVSLVEEGLLEETYPEFSRMGRFSVDNVPDYLVVLINRGKGEWNDDHTIIRYSDAWWEAVDTFEMLRIQGTITFKRG